MEKTAYMSCNSSHYEGAVDLYCKHLTEVHGCTTAELDGINGFSEGHWLAADRLHRNFLAAGR